MNLIDFDFELLTEFHDLFSFDCDDQDINEFLKVDSLKYQKEKLANTYVFHSNNKVACFFSLLNDSLHDKGYDGRVWNRFHRKRRIPNEKRIWQYPAIKIGRLGVDKKYQGKGLAYDMMSFLKIFSLENHKPACRLLLVDAYNKPKQLSYYINNGFVVLDDGFTKDTTKLMYFDMLQLG